MSSINEDSKGTPLNNSINSNNSTNKCNLIVNYLPQSLKEQDFNLLFSKIGPIKASKLMYDKQTGKL